MEAAGWHLFTCRQLSHPEERRVRLQQKSCLNIRFVPATLLL